MSKQTKRERELAAEVKVMAGLAKAAAARGSFAPAVAARGKVSALKSELSRLRAERLAEGEPDPLERVKRLRRLATEAGSYTSASALAKLEAEMQAARDLATATTGDGLDEATPAEIMAVITGAIRTLPDPLVVGILEACEVQLNGPKLQVV